MSKDDIESYFGQSSVFDLDNKDVDPRVLAYIKQVRTEALSITAISSAENDSRKRKRSTNSDDEEEDENQDARLPDHLIDFLDRLPLIILWYDDCISGKREKEEESSGDEDNDEDIMSSEENEIIDKGQDDYMEETKEEEVDFNAILLSKLNEYFKAQKYKPWTDKIQLLIESNNLNIQNTPDNLHLDEVWARDFAMYLLSKSITSYKELYELLLNFQEQTSKTPETFDDWVQYIKKNSSNSGMSYDVPLSMQFPLLTHIAKNHLMYNYSKVIVSILLALPDKLFGSQVSVLRDLGKLCALYLYRIEAMSTSKTFREVVVQEENSGIIPFNVAELILAVLSEKYGQKDIITWDEYLL